MSGEQDQCRPLVDDDGQVVANVRGAELDTEARGHMLAIVEAARRLHTATDTPERQARYEAGRARIRGRNARLRKATGG